MVQFFANKIITNVNNPKENPSLTNIFKIEPYG